MDDLGKVNSLHLYNLWKNLTIGLVTIIAMMTFSCLLSHFLSPVVSLIAAAFLYVYIYSIGGRGGFSCMVIPYAMLISLMAYSFTAIGINILYAWGMKGLPKELVFFSSPFIPSLIYMPIATVVMLTFIIRKRSLFVCTSCKACSSGSAAGSDNRMLSNLLASETSFQLKNLTMIFAVLTVIIWTYYIVFYVNINVNARDWYVFIWLQVIVFILDEMYFMARYYNLYLDMRENDEIITPGELSDMTAKTYLRYYVICGNNVFVDAHALDPNAPYKEIIDTPFFTNRAVNGISLGDVKNIIEKMTGYPGGELRFFYGRKNSDSNKHSVLRYFYFLDGDVSNYQNMNVDGEWMDYEKIKYLYSNNPGRLAAMSVVDTTRLATIIVTEKIYDERGYRKSKIKVYNPSFNLIDVRKSDLDFQDDKWIDISVFNSDTPFYGLKKWWRGMMSNPKNRKGEWR